MSQTVPSLITYTVLCPDEQNEARKLNHAEVVEEDKRNKLPANWEARKRKAEWELAEEEAKKVHFFLCVCIMFVFPPNIKLFVPMVFTCRMQ